MKALILGALVSFVTASQAKLVVQIEEPKATGGKSLIRITLKNTFKEEIESARATLFLLDDNNKIVGQSTAWVIGGAKNKPPLAPDAANSYNFLIRADKPFTTTKLTFSRIILEGGKSIHPQQGAEIAK